VFAEKKARVSPGREKRREISRSLSIRSHCRLNETAASALPIREELLRVLLQDARVRLIEISNYASLRDQDQNCVNKLVDWLCAGLKK
jgi:hypothetical protein